jgi:hypothetical protein
VVRQAWTLWGLPGAFRVDNGVPWGSAGDLPTDLALWVLGMGVGMIWNPPHTPQRNGVIERFQGVGQQWTEPWLCRSAAELQQRLDAMDRLQREEYPVAEGKSRMQAFPGLAHSGRPYDLAWEEAHWSLDAVVEHLAVTAWRGGSIGKGWFPSTIGIIMWARALPDNPCGCSSTLRRSSGCSPMPTAANCDSERRRKSVANASWPWT